MSYSWLEGCRKNKASDSVPRRVTEWALRMKKVEERFVRVIMEMYDGARTKVRVINGLSEEFEVKVGVHQGSVLSPFLFNIVMDVVCGKLWKAYCMKFCMLMIWS